MKLSKKFCDLIDNDNGYDNQLLADRCEKLSDDFAIGFAMWAGKNPLVTKVNSYTDLIVKYKKEKGL